MATANTARRAVVHAFLSGCAVAAVAGCLGDPPPDPATAPLEVVLDGCLLNRPEVAAGTHDLALVGDGLLLVTDEAGREVLSLPGGAATLVTSSQRYTFTCTVGTDVTSTTLESVSTSASPVPSKWTLEMAKTALDELNLTSPPSPQYFLDVDAALDAHGVPNQPQRLLRWGGTGDTLAANKPLPALGAGINVITTHRAPEAVASDDHCRLLGGDPNSMLVEPPADRCAITRLADGVLVVVDASSMPTTARDPATDRYQTAVTQAVFDTGEAVVSVTTWVQDTPAANKVTDPHPVDVATLARLAQDPRMRW